MFVPDGFIPALFVPASCVASRCWPPGCAGAGRRLIIVMYGQLVPLMAGLEAESLIEPMRIHPSLVGRQLHDPRAPATGLGDGKPDHRLAKPLAPAARPNPNSFYFAARRALQCETGDQGELKGADHGLALKRNVDRRVRVRADPIPGRLIGGKIGRRFPQRADCIIGEKRDDSFQMRRLSGSKNRRRAGENL